MTDDEFLPDLIHSQFELDVVEGHRDAKPCKSVDPFLDGARSAAAEIKAGNSRSIKTGDRLTDIDIIKMGQEEAARVTVIK